MTWNALFLPLCICLDLKCHLLGGRLDLPIPTSAPTSLTPGFPLTMFFVEAISVLLHLSLSTACLSLQSRFPAVAALSGLFTAVSPNGKEPEVHRDV